MGKNYFLPKYLFLLKNDFQTIWSKKNIRNWIWKMTLADPPPYFGLFQWEKIIFCQNTYFCLKMIFRPCYFYFFSALCQWGGWVLKSAENSALLFFLKPSLSHLLQLLKNRMCKHGVSNSIGSAISNCLTNGSTPLKINLKQLFYIQK